MKSVFEEARKVAKAEGGCIIFLDEIDSFARHRMTENRFGGSISHNACINQFLVFEPREAGFEVVCRQTL